VYADRGYEAFVTTITYNDQTYYRVRVGDMQSLSEATDLKAEIEDKYSTTGWVDRLNQ
jgi:cell division septation protein DedD